MTTKMKVLIIDAEPGVRDMLRMVLLLNDIEALCAGDGQNVAALLEETCFDAIISDYSLPGMNGAEVIRKVRTLYPQMLAIGISTGVNKTYFIESGADAVLVKPFSPDDLLALLLPRMR
ncbi:MAG: response regulator [Nitrospirales bacterium]|nr:response regulator [Nitrospirales bacterium]